MGSPASQTTFEYLALYLVLRVWGDAFARQGLAILGDNVSSLGCVVNLKGRAALANISREIAWRRIRRSWRYMVAHVPSEHNGLAYALSRLAAPSGSEKREFPTRALSGARRRDTPEAAGWWQAKH